MSSAGRNAPCPCGSGKKYKNCCFGKAATIQPAYTQETPAQSDVQLFQIALQHHQAGRLPEAEAIYQKILQVAPGNADALHLSGLVAYQTGKIGEAVGLISKAVSVRPSSPMYYNLGLALKAQGSLEAAVENYNKALLLKPDYAEAYNNLGNTLKLLDKLDEAATSFRKALALRPNNAEAHNNLGIVLRGQNKPDEAITSYRRALALKPDYAEALNNLGNIYKEQDKLNDAVACYRKALALKPDYADTHGNMGVALQKLGQLDDALACFQQQLKLTPANSVIQHHIASLTGSNTERAPDQYVETVFDDYADKFDVHLQQVLGYDIPEKMVALVTQHLTPPPEKWDVLDLGCGTGLAGLSIAPFARRLVGVDLSTKMLGKAHARNLYQRLEHADLLTMMRGEETSGYDVIIAADVFVYLGKLDEIVSEVKRLLGPGGVFAFSVEALGALSNRESDLAVEQEYRLENTGRYSHSSSYITKLAVANDLLVQEMITTRIRMEHGQPVNGYLVLWKK